MLHACFIKGSAGNDSCACVAEKSLQLTVSFAHGEGWHGLHYVKLI